MEIKKDGRGYNGRSYKASDNSMVFYVLYMIFSLLPISSYAGECSPFQISLWPPAQLVPGENTVCGARLNLIRGYNFAVWGIDLGILNDTVQLKGLQVGVLTLVRGRADDKNDSWGLQVAGINLNGNSLFIGVQLGFITNMGFGSSITGIQAAPMNFFGGEINGLQLAAFNEAIDVNGIQVGLFNKAQNIIGLQIGLLNACKTLSGVQIGLFNYAKNGPIVFMPILNIGF
jgi:hypothetical protein